MTLIPQNLNPYISARMEFVAAYAETHPEQADALNRVVDGLKQEQDPTTALMLMHTLQRYYQAAKAGVLDKPDVMNAIEDMEKFPLWENFSTMPMTDTQKDTLAKLLYEGDLERRSPILMLTSDCSRGISERILERCVAEQDEVDVLIADPVFQRRLLVNCDEEQAKRLGVVMMEQQKPCARRISTRIEQPQHPYQDKPAAKEVLAVYNAAVAEENKTVRDKFYTLSVLPTPKDAELDGIPYDDYVDLFCRMFSVDWEKVDAAHKILIAQLNAASMVHFTNDDGTDVSIGIKNYTFCNSLVAKNVPGSEVFSGVEIDSVNGVVVGDGRYMFKGEMMEGITLTFENGVVTDYQAKKGHDVLKKMIETDEGSCRIGELGIGTNPVLRQHLVNGLMVEKIGGSFHLALGQSYTFTDYCGEPVHVDNGNRSEIHEDLTFMLFGKNGKMFIDGELVMDDGRFLDPRLAYLNEPN